jgi:hypothetical protein
MLVTPLGQRPKLLESARESNHGARMEFLKPWLRLNTPEKAKVQKNAAVIPLT